MNEATNIVTVQMEKDQSFTVTLNGREVLDVVQVGQRFGAQQAPDFDESRIVTVPDGTHTVCIEMKVAQYNVLQAQPDADEEERAMRGELIAAHEQGECIMQRMKDGGSWTQANPTRDGWQWNEWEYARLK